MTDRRDQHWDHALLGDTHPDQPHPDDVHYDDLQHDDLQHDDLHHADVHYDDVHYDDVHDGYGDHPTGTRTTRRTAQRRKQSRTGRAAKRFLVLIVALGLVVAAAIAAVAVVKPMFAGLGGGDNDYPGPGTGAVTVVVSPGDTGRTIGATLEQAGVVKTAKAFTDAAAANPESANIQPGTYTMKEQMRASDAVALLADPANRDVTKVTIREGLWKAETFAALSKATGIPVSQYEAAAKNADALGLPAEAKGNIEGYLFPATYDFAPKSTAAEQLKTMVAKAVSELSQAGVAPGQMQRTLTLASIVEAEGKTDADRAKIARVLDNRLAQGMPLQLDSTVSYGDQKRTVTTTDAQRANAANRYNTYLHDGLPPGPIGNPGAASIEAALNPAAGPWLFFVTVNPTTGETKFATTAQEHDQYVAQFQAWCQANKGQC